MGEKHTGEWLLSLIRLLKAHCLSLPVPLPRQNKRYWRGVCPINYTGSEHPGTLCIWYWGYTQWSAIACPQEQTLDCKKTNPIDLGISDVEDPCCTVCTQFGGVCLGTRGGRTTCTPLYWPLVSELCWFVQGVGEGALWPASPHSLD